MYVSTYGGLAQLPTMYSAFAGTLGEKSPFLPAIQEFLNQVRQRPQSYKKLLLTVTFHPRPMDSQIKVTIGKSTFNLIDAGLLFGLEAPVAFLDELRRISANFQKRDARFKRQIEAELELRNEMIRTAGDRAMRLGLQMLRPILIEALLKDDFSFYHWQLGLSSAPKLLPANLVQRIRNSEVSEAHLTHLGKFLRRYAEVALSKNADFKAAVERERKRRQQEREEQQRRAREEEERKRRQQRRRR